jgi:hypothetical protein
MEILHWPEEIAKREAEGNEGGETTRLEKAA